MFQAIFEHTMEHSLDIRHKYVEEKLSVAKKYATNKKIHNFCKIIMKLGQNDRLMSWSFWPSVIIIGKKRNMATSDYFEISRTVYSQTQWNTLPQKIDWTLINT